MIPLIWQLVGLVNGSAPTNSNTYQLGGPGSDSVGVGGPFLGGQGLWLNGSGSHTGFPSGIPPYIDVCWNITLQLVWFLTATPNTWNFDATANPNTNAGGWSFAGLNAGPYYAAMSEIVRTGTTYPSILLVTNGNIGSAIGTPPMCYVPW